MGKVILCGPSASGKDYARKKFETKGFKLGVSFTTRDPRPGEVNGEDYLFITKEDFEGMIEQDMWLEYDRVDNKLEDGTVISDYYGTTKEQFELFDLFIMTPSGISKIPKEYHDQFVVIGFDIDEDIRIKRMKSGRGWEDGKIDTRLSWEKKEFADYYADIKVKNEDF